MCMPWPLCLGFIGVRWVNGKFVGIHLGERRQCTKVVGLKGVGHFIEVF